MILRRLVKHITDQNWFAVGLDVIVVIVGIFLGLQVQAWYEERQDRLQEVIYIERLLDDAESSIIDQKADLERHKLRLDSARSMVNMLYREQVSDENIDDFSTYNHNLNGRDTLDFFRDTINELITTGKLDVITSVEFRGAIARFRDEVRTNDVFGLAIGETIRNSRYAINLHLTRDIDQYRVIIPYEKLNGSTKIYNLVNSIVDYYNLFYTNQLEFHEETVTFKNEVAKELKRLK